MKSSIRAVFIAVGGCLLAGSAPPGSAPPRSATLGHSQPFAIERTWLRMPDGVRLSATVFRPSSSQAGARHPVLLEMLPYRKDDSFYLRDYPHYTYFASRGFIAVKVDVRGTGSSEGAVPPREYSDREIGDGVEIIRQLAAWPGSNGKVGMWGISWGGFNAIQIAMRQPPGLAAILAVDASDDLYHDDVHYLDGILHGDLYQLSIDHENGLPRSPGYELDAAYFRDRFDQPPWLLAYLGQQRDGPFWRKGSLRWQYDRLEVPAYLIGGLLDGYRDSVPRMLAALSGPVKAQVGPWNHDFPDTGEPGPNYEWRDEAVRWWNRWLRGAAEEPAGEPRLAVFVRSGHGPDAKLLTTPGRWQYEDWPIRRTAVTPYYPSGDGRLLSSPAAPGIRNLRYVPGSGTAGGDWWGEPTGDMRADDATSLVFDSGPLASPIEIVGLPEVHVRAAAGAPLAHWVARLEDVQPDGSVSLVTGGARNGSQRKDRLKPEAHRPGTFENLDIGLHFTTWTFAPGHRIRLAISNAQFPMLWPTPYAMTSKVRVGEAETRLVLPVTGRPGLTEPRPVPRFPAPAPRLQRPDAAWLEVSGPESERKVLRDAAGNPVAYVMATREAYRIGRTRYDVTARCEWRTNNENPADSSFSGKETTRIASATRRLELETRLAVRSDRRHLRATFARRILENGRAIRHREWRRTYPRDFQ